MAAEKKRRSFTEVRSRALELRLKAMRPQLTAAFHYCATAENAFAFGRVQLGIDAVQKAKHTAEKVRAHLEEPNQDAVAGVSDDLAELEKQISILGGRVQP